MTDNLVTPEPVVTPSATVDAVEQWSLQFSNVPPFINIWAAIPGHDPRNKSIACCQFENVAERNRQIEQFRQIVEAHNAALSPIQSEPIASPVGELLEEAAFLCARLRDLEGSLLDDDAGRDFNGHVSPSLARLEALLANQASSQSIEGGAE